MHFEIERQAAGAGPQGFRSQQRVFDTHDYGILTGTVALRAKYDPLAEVESMIEGLKVWNAGDDEGGIIDAIASMNQRQRERGYAVLTNVDHKQFPAFARKLADFVEFFDSRNLTTLSRWGSDHRNANRVEVTDRAINLGVRQIQIAGAGCLTRLAPSADLFVPMPEWQAIPKRRD